jgi:Fur family zinc uptake transcriptional regulator
MKPVEAGEHPRPQGPVHNEAGLTEVQRQAYAILLATRAPLAAYDLLRALETATGKRIYPQTVYRLLDVLMTRGMVHKVESSNAFSACAHPHQPHDGIHLVCGSCGMADEVVDSRVSRMLAQDAQGAGFHLQTQIIELRGVCASCVASGSAGS